MAPHSKIQEKTAARTLLMTGGTAGLGARALALLLKENPTLRAIVLARHSDHALKLETQLGAGERLRFIWVDLADLRSVQNSCDEILAALDRRPLTHVALNAGLQAIGTQQVSHDGLELAFAVNHLAHFLLVERLKDHFADGCRIVLTASEVHDPTAFCLVGIARAMWQDPLDLADPERSQSHISDLVDRGEARYAASKLLNIMMARHWATEMPRAVVCDFNPSVMPGTNIARERNVLQRFAWNFIMAPLARFIPGARSIEESASDLVYLLTRARADAVTGQYVNGRVVEPGSPDSRDPNKIERVLEVSKSLLLRAEGVATAETGLAHGSLGFRPAPGRYPPRF